MNKFHILKFGTVQRYLEKGSRHGWCNYYKGFDKDRKKKKFHMYDINKNYIGTYTGVKEFSRQSLDVFGVMLHTSGIGNVCNGRLKQYKGYVFEWANES